MNMKKAMQALALAGGLFLVGCSAVPVGSGGNLKTHNSPSAEIYTDVMSFGIVVKDAEGRASVKNISFSEADLGKFALQSPIFLKDRQRLIIGSVPDYTQKGTNDNYNSDSPYWTQENKNALMRPALLTGYYSSVVDLESLLPILMKKRNIFGINGELSAVDLATLDWNDNDLMLDGALTAIQPIGGSGGGAEADDIAGYSTKAGVKAQYTFNLKRAGTQKVLYSFTVEVDVTKLTYGLDLSGYFGKNFNYKHLDFSSTVYSRLSTAHQQAASWAIVRATGFLNGGDDVVTNIPYEKRMSYDFQLKEESLIAQEKASSLDIAQAEAEKRRLEGLYFKLNKLLESAHLDVGHAKLSKLSQGTEICREERTEHNPVHPKDDGVRYSEICFVVPHLADNNPKRFEKSYHEFVLEELKGVNKNIKTLDQARAFQANVFFEIQDMSNLIQAKKEAHKRLMDTIILNRVQLYSNGVVHGPVTIQNAIDKVNALQGNAQ